MHIQRENFFSPLTYSEYVELLSEQFILKMPEHLQAYTKLNAQRMHRWEKTYVPSQLAQNVAKSNHALRHSFIITEPWCGDAAHCIPAIHKLLSLTSQMADPMYLLRDGNLDLMDQFTTHGKRSIPILILTDADFHVLGHWGPRPASAQILVDEAKKSDDGSGKWMEELQSWYNQNKQSELESEIIKLIQQCNMLSKNC